MRSLVPARILTNGARDGGEGARVICLFTPPFWSVDGSNPDRVRQLLQDKDNEIASLKAQLSNVDELKKRERALVLKLSTKEQEMADLEVTIGWSVILPMTRMFED